MTGGYAEANSKINALGLAGSLRISRLLPLLSWMRVYDSGGGVASPLGIPTLAFTPPGFAMKIQPATIRCKTCKHDFQCQLLVECSIELFAKALKDIRCLKCGKAGKNLLLVFTKPVKD